MIPMRVSFMRAAPQLAVPLIRVGDGREPRQLRRARAAALGAVDRAIVELDALARGAQQQPAATHVAAAHEVAGEEQRPAEHRRQHVDVLRRRDAAEQHDLGPRGSRARSASRVLAQRRGVAALGRVDRHAANARRSRERDRGLGRHEPAARRDHEHAGAPSGGAAKRCA